VMTLSLRRKRKKLHEVSPSGENAFRPSPEKSLKRTGRQLEIACVSECVRRNSLVFPLIRHQYRLCGKTKRQLICRAAFPELGTRRLQWYRAPRKTRRPGVSFRVTAAFHEWRGLLRRGPGNIRNAWYPVSSSVLIARLAVSRSASHIKFLRRNRPSLRGRYE